MAAAVWTGPDTIEIHQVPVPELPAGSALVRIEYTGLCGTDFSILRGTHPRAQTPLIMGHEIIGVVEVPAAGGPPAGTRVTVEPLITCGRCRPCLEGTPHVCRNLGLYGIDAPGSLAEFVALPAGALIPVAQHVPAREAALAEPLAVAVHAVDRSGLQGGEHVLVFGAGPIGILTALVARYSGAASVLIAEPNKGRAAAARALGFETVTADADPVQTVIANTGGNGADIVFDTAGQPAVAAMLPAASRARGTIVLVGVYKKPAEVDLQAVTFSELSVIGVRVYTRTDVERAVGLLEDDALGLSRLAVQVFALADTALAFDLAMSPGPVLKVLISPEPSDPTPEGRTQ